MRRGQFNGFFQGRRVERPGPGETRGTQKVVVVMQAGRVGVHHLEREGGGGGGERRERECGGRKE
jgi:hypothetical protein